jgi:predicted NAD/FAD-binding protein
MPTYHHPEIERVVAMTEAKAYQMVLVDPTNKDDKVYKAIRKASNCWSYYSDVRSLPFDEAIEKFSNRLLDKVFNTRARLSTFMDYENILSTKLTLVPLTPLRLLNTSYCNQNIDVLP